MDLHNQYLHLQGVDPDLLGHRFVDNQVHKGYHHSLDPGLFHPLLEVVTLVNM